MFMWFISAFIVAVFWFVKLTKLRKLRFLRILRLMRQKLQLFIHVCFFFFFPRQKNTPIVFSHGFKITENITYLPLC